MDNQFNPNQPSTLITSEQVPKATPAAELAGATAVNAIPELITSEQVPTPDTATDFAVSEAPELITSVPGVEPSTQVVQEGRGVVEVPMPANPYKVIGYPAPGENAPIVVDNNNLDEAVPGKLDDLDNSAA